MLIVRTEITSFQLDHQAFESTLKQSRSHVKETHISEEIPLLAFRVQKWVVRMGRRKIKKPKGNPINLKRKL